MKNKPNQTPISPPSGPPQRLFQGPPAKSKFLAAIAAAMTCGGASAATLAEGFDVVLPLGWTATNNSEPVGLTDWFQGNDAVFPAHAGAPTSYVGANFNNTSGEGTISNWLIGPTLIFNDGDLVSFWTRTVSDSTFPDRLELRFSSVGGTDVGVTSTDVGTFSLLLSVNPNLTTDGYPKAWTQYSSTIAGLGGPTSGAIAFRYFVTNGGPFGANSDYIGIDTVSITAVPEPSAYLIMALGLGTIGLRRMRATRG